ncbi:hypothetical protein JAAARDRAFT_141534 [Jaapia argillacea MUCL 33604]|uniref:Carotenoid oxygenase n=1 Tax=Jaapia argillacea MUCL 33604 TaxID=933084 RepID=A0A067PJQ0_9AGAM|nr:hypothetical protein JAAARDRAFT_141534 [Jaapia argillacea MUCL 33604]
MSALASKPLKAPGCAIGFENAIEQREPVALRVKGQIPPWLRGNLYRTGPGTFRVPSSAAPSGSVDLTHWFDGLGMTHRFEITSSGGVMYRNHSTADGLRKRIEKSGSVPGVTFGDQDPCETIFSKFFTMFRPNAETPPKPIDGAADEVNIQVTLTPDMPGFASHHSIPSSTTTPRYLVAKSDNDTLQILDPETLKPLHATTYAELDPRLDGHISAAHSCRDKTTDEFYNFSLKMGGRPVYKVFRVRPNPSAEKGFEVDVLAEINDAPPAYLHSFVMTQKYVVLCIWQADFNYGATIPLNRNIASSLEKKWNPNRNTLFYVIDRHTGGLVSKFKSPPFFCFHAINAYDSGSDDVTIDLSVYDNHSVIDLLYLDSLRNLSAEQPMRMGRARRFILENVSSQVQAGKGVREAVIPFTLSQSSSIELPTVHPALYHKPYRFAYGMNKLDPKTHHTFADRIIKLDMSQPNSEPKTWGVPGYTPGEPIFVPRPGATSPSDAEDDGVILSLVLDGEAQKSMLVVLDAKEMKEVARAEMETHFPFVFHGVFTPA